MSQFELCSICIHFEIQCPLQKIDSWQYNVLFKHFYNVLETLTVNIFPWWRIIWWRRRRGIVVLRLILLVQVPQCQEHQDGHSDGGRDSLAKVALAHWQLYPANSSRVTRFPKVRYLQFALSSDILKLRMPKMVCIIVNLCGLIEILEYVLCLTCWLSCLLSLCLVLFWPT